MPESKSVPSRFVLAGTILLGSLLALAAAAAETDPPVGAGDEAIVKALAPIREKHGVPAMAGGVVTGAGTLRQGVVGVRKIGTEVKATLADYWHLGSDTKAMTATILAKLVEEGKLNWASTLGELFPDRADAMKPAFRKATVRQLLSHRAGLPANLFWRSLARTGSLGEQRLRALETATAKEPVHPPGERYLYSNTGYVLAGAVIEKVTGKPWEEAARAMIFTPLEMKSAGFGGTGTPGEIDQPWPHLGVGRPAAANGPKVDNAALLGPAGTVHCTLADWAKFIADQLAGSRGQAGLLKPASYRALHTPPEEGSYALGWTVTARKWGGGRVLTHAGCNTMNYAVVWMSPKRDFAVLVCVNQGDGVAAKAADEAAGVLIGLR